MQRRELLALAGTTVAGALISPASVLQDLAMTLIEDGNILDFGVELRPVMLAPRVAAMKQAYQACHYEVVAEELPGLLRRLESAERIATGQDRHDVAGLAAQAYHVAASVFLKLDGVELASVAADRSMDAAHRSEDPLVVGASARILTHALMSSGRYRDASNAAGKAAEQLARSVDAQTDDSTSVYGSLLLRGAIAASQGEDGSTSRSLLDEAGEAAARLAPGANHHWTAFGADNVLAHRMAVEITLGNAGLAIDHVRQIDFEGLGIPERKATVLIDAARAYTQWGKYDRAVSALHAAGEVAGQELRVRQPVRGLVHQIRTSAPASAQSNLGRLVERHGIAA